MRRSRIKLGIRAKLFLISLGLIALALSVGYGYVAPAVDEALIHSISDDMDVRLDLVIRLLSQLPPPQDSGRWRALAMQLGQLTRTRVTFINNQGEVLGDSEVAEPDVQKLENHGHRPEVLAALKNSRGRSTRLSSTLGLRMIYVAAPATQLHGERLIARIAVPLVDVDRNLRRLHWSFAIAAILALSVAGAMSSFAAHFAARSVRNLTAIARRMVRGEMGMPSSTEGHDEMATLGRDLDQLADRLRRLESLRRDFVANVSHELRTPVTALRSAAETLRFAAQNDPEAAQRFLDIIERNAERLQNMVEDLLDLSRIESQKLRLNPVALSLRECGEHMLEMFASRADKKHIQMTLAMPDNLPRVSCDKRSLEQVLVNLIDNAIKYCPSGARITLSAVPLSNKSVRIAVADTGPGIEARHLPRLFERFYRVDAGRSREVGGTGLGLAIVKHLLEAMGSEVSVESEVGKGSIFTFNLPQAHLPAEG